MSAAVDFNGKPDAVYLGKIAMSGDRHEWHFFAQLSDTTYIEVFDIDEGGLKNLTDDQRLWDILEYDEASMKPAERTEKPNLWCGEVGEMVYYNWAPGADNSRYEEVTEL